MKKGVASGDANLYLRNVLYLMKQGGLIDNLESYMKSIFPKFWIDVSFNPKKDVYIEVRISLKGPYGKKIPLELAGTGIQQSLQIFSYTILFKPAILLLDEPDSHLHPDNQSLLANILLTLTSSTNTKIIASTHSRHLVDALYDEANFVWLKNGKVYDQGYSLDRLTLLIDLGALGSFDRLREGQVEWVFLTEDSSKKYIKKLAKSSGYNMANSVFYSYRTSSQLNSALYLAEFIKDIAPDTKIIIHRDRDFLTNEEVEWVSKKIKYSGAFPFITVESDIEGYYITPNHLSELIDKDEEEIEAWISDIATKYHNQLMHKFTRKRDEAKILYRRRDEEPPETMVLLGEDTPLPPEKRLGKFMFKKIRGGIKGQFGVNVDITQETLHLTSQRLTELLENA